jgi:hypothetical protein
MFLSLGEFCSCEISQLSEPLWMALEDSDISYGGYYLPFSVKGLESLIYGIAFPSLTKVDKEISVGSILLSSEFSVVSREREIEIYRATLEDVRQRIACKFYWFLKSNGG